MVDAGFILKCMFIGRIVMVRWNFFPAFVFLCLSVETIEASPVETEISPDMKEMVNALYSSNKQRLSRAKSELAKWPTTKLFTLLESPNICDDVMVYQKRCVYQNQVFSIMIDILEQRAMQEMTPGSKEYHLCQSTQKCASRALTSFLDVGPGGGNLSYFEFLEAHDESQRRVGPTMAKLRMRVRLLLRKILTDANPAKSFLQGMDAVSSLDQQVFYRPMCNNFAYNFTICVGNVYYFEKDGKKLLASTTIPPQDSVGKSEYEYEDFFGSTVAKLFWHDRENNMFGMLFGIQEGEPAELVRAVKIMQRKGKRLVETCEKIMEFPHERILVTDFLKSPQSFMSPHCGAGKRGSP
ncbi:MAG: hypothetical protein OEZ39_19860 [Gammaproteobacteria bacterium]|nr:hypothetical protein [Gammaproteobacteria bacterium]